jgi:hypothetical protein
VGGKVSKASIRILEGPDVPYVAVLAGLDRADYREAFAADVRVDRPPEEWCRLILEGASPAKRAAMLRTWTLLGVGLAPLGSEGQILGWRIRHSGADAVVLGARSRTGLDARLVVSAPSRQVVQTMMIRYDRWPARPLWTIIAPQHRRFVYGLLADAVAR